MKRLPPTGQVPVMAVPRTRLTAYAGIVSSALTTVLLAAPFHATSILGALVLACVPAGAAVMCWIDSGEAAAQVALILTISLSTVALVSAVMIWTTVWEPRVLLGLAALSVASCSYRLRRGVSR